MRLNKNDEWYTPYSAVWEFMHLFNWNGWHVWFPFDDDTSNFVRYANIHHINYTNTHISTGCDFFDTYVKADVIISNPPYSKKYDVLKRLIELDKPFAMLMSTGIFNNGKCLELFKNPNIRFLFIKKRINFIGSTTTPPFNSVWVLYKLYHDEKVI